MGATQRDSLPDFVRTWFAARGWRPHAYQTAMVEAFRAGRPTLLIAPTGGGKTLSGFLPCIIDIAETNPDALHTLYISPLKALTNDIERNLAVPLREMRLDIRVETRTGDTPTAKRQRQRRDPPQILLTTPESLMLMLSYADAGRLFGRLRAVIVDEVHSFAHSKRGDFTALALARLGRLAPGHLRFGLSATVAEPGRLCDWLGGSDTPAQLMDANLPMQPEIGIVASAARMPYGGFMARYAVGEIYAAIRSARTAIVFVNTRAQAELILQLLWEVNSDGLPITIYHGSLAREQRRKTEAMMAAGRLRAVVATAALELGIDWGDVDLVIQVGAPKGVSRLLQRIGRSNHRLDMPSRALMVPANRFEALECVAALAAIGAGRLDGEDLLPGALDVVAQYIVNCACSHPVAPDELFAEIRAATPYRDLTRETFDRLFRFAVDGGYVLRNYPRYHRLTQENGRWRLSHPSVARRHRQNVGTIVEAARLKVKRGGVKGRGGKIIGEVEEYFAQGLNPGDTFLFAGEVLEFVGIREMTLEARPAVKTAEPKIPSYVGGQMPLSTFLAEGVRTLLAEPERWGTLPADVLDWLDLQRQFSAIPAPGSLLVEHFPWRRFNYTVLYSFEGRKANQTLGMLITRRMETMGLKPVSFLINDYALAVSSLEGVEAGHVPGFLSPDILGDDLEEWIIASPMLKRAFRHVATVAGLVEQQNSGVQKSMRQMTLSTDLIYDVLLKHEPDHILLGVARRDAERELLDLKRLSAMLNRFHNRWHFMPLDRASPFSIPVLTEVRTEQVRGSGIEALLTEAALQKEAEQLMEGVRAALA